jgi:hypothetical protein
MTAKGWQYVTWPEWTMATVDIDNTGTQRYIRCFKVATTHLWSESYRKAAGSRKQAPALAKSAHRTKLWCKENRSSFEVSTLGLDDHI